MSRREAIRDELIQTKGVGATRVSLGAITTRGTHAFAGRYGTVEFPAKFKGTPTVIPGLRDGDVGPQVVSLWSGSFSYRALTRVIRGTHAMAGRYGTVEFPASRKFFGTPTILIQVIAGRFEEPLEVRTRWPGSFSYFGTPGGGTFNWLAYGSARSGAGTFGWLAYGSAR